MRLRVGNLQLQIAIGGVHVFVILLNFLRKHEWSVPCLVVIRLNLDCGLQKIDVRLRPFPLPGTNMTKPIKNALKIQLIGLILATHSACGGGGGGQQQSANVTPPAQQDPTLANSTLDSPEVLKTFRQRKITIGLNESLQGQNPLFLKITTPNNETLFLGEVDSSSPIDAITLDINVAADVQIVDYQFFGNNESFETVFGSMTL